MQPPITQLATERGAVTIRPTTAADAAAYRALRLDALARHPEVYGADADEHAAQPPVYWEQMTGRSGPAGGLLVAEAGGQLVGAARLDRTPSRKLGHTASIYSMYVAAEWRGTPVAAALIAGCCEWAAALGVRVVKLSVVTTNTAAIRLYARCGFTVYGVEPEGIAWDGVYYDELWMVRRLSSADAER